jgi:hypothetical protein
VVLLLLLAACAHGGERGTAEDLSPTRLRGPEVAVEASRLAPDREGACARVAPLRVLPEGLGDLAVETGVLPDDLAALRGTAQRLGVTVTLRDSNPACGPHLLAGVESKGHDVMTKTFTAESLPDEHKHLAGTVSTLARKPGPGEVLADPESLRHLTPQGQPLTCDYDLMDVMGRDGKRVEGESAADLQVRAALNAGLPLRGDPPRAVARVKHGAQAEYPAYLRARARAGHPETPVLSLNKPESPLTALSHDGTVLRLRTVEDALNLYACLGASVPREWNLRVR